MGRGRLGRRVRLGGGGSVRPVSASPALVQRRPLSSPASASSSRYDEASSSVRHGRPSRIPESSSRSFPHGSLSSAPGHGARRDGDAAAALRHGYERRTAAGTRLSRRPAPPRLAAPAAGPSRLPASPSPALSPGRSPASRPAQPAIYSLPLARSHGAAETAPTPPAAANGDAASDASAGGQEPGQAAAGPPEAQSSSRLETSLLDRRV